MFFINKKDCTETIVKYLQINLRFYTFIINNNLRYLVYYCNKTIQWKSISTIWFSEYNYLVKHTVQKYLLSCSTEDRNSYRFGTTCGYVNDNWIYIFGWTIPLRSKFRFSSNACTDKMYTLNTIKIQEIKRSSQAPASLPVKKRAPLTEHQWIGNKCAQRNRLFHMREENSWRTGQMFPYLHPSFAYMSLDKSTVCVKCVSSVSHSPSQTLIFCSPAAQRVASWRWMSVGWSRKCYLQFVDMQPTHLTGTLKCSLNSQKKLHRLFLYC